MLLGELGELDVAWVRCVLLGLFVPAYSPSPLPPPLIPPLRLLSRLLFSSSSSFYTSSYASSYAHASSYPYTFFSSSNSSVVTTREQALDELETLSAKEDCCLVIDGESLQLCMDECRERFVAAVLPLPAVVCCRCSPTQKADIVRLVQAHTTASVLAIGDGGNDVSMIQAANVGVGIAGKEGMQASLAADYALLQFSHLTRLLLWHGRNSCAEMMT